jgi:hypothetical protein
MIHPLILYLLLYLGIRLILLIHIVLRIELLLIVHIHLLLLMELLHVIVILNNLSVVNWIVRQLIHEINWRYHLLLVLMDKMRHWYLSLIAIVHAL